MKALFYFLSFFFISNLFADELVIVQTVSGTKETFVIRKGAEDGITPGQESLFTNNAISILAKAIEVTKNFSAWKPVMKNAVIPFKKDHYVIYSPSKEKIWQNIAEIHSQISVHQELKENLGEPPEFHCVIKGGLAQSFNTRTTLVSSESEIDRSGQSIEISFGKRVIPEFEMNFGFRLDAEKEKVTTKNSTLPITSTSNRYMLTTDFTYHLGNNTRYNNPDSSFYVSLGAAYGQNRASILEHKTKGRAYVFPQAKIGMLRPLNQDRSLVFELIGEGINVVDNFANNTSQETTMFVGRATFGVRF